MEVSIIVVGIVIIAMMAMGYKLYVTYEENGKLVVEIKNAKTSIKTLNDSAKARRLDYMNILNDNKSLANTISQYKEKSKESTQEAHQNCMGARESKTCN